MTRLSILSPALDEIDAIYRHIAQDNLVAAVEVIDRIYEIIEVLVANPGLGRKTRRSGVKQFVAVPYSYVILFRYLPKYDELRVLSVRHGARRRPALQEEAREFRV